MGGVVSTAVKLGAEVGSHFPAAVSILISHNSGGGRSTSLGGLRVTPSSPLWYQTTQHSPLTAFGKAKAIPQTELLWQRGEPCMPTRENQENPPLLFIISF